MASSGDGAPAAGTRRRSPGRLPLHAPAAWERTTIDTLGTHEAQAVDLDGDGLPDLVGHDENTDLVGTNGPVHAWQNDTGT